MNLMRGASLDKERRAILHDSLPFHSKIVGFVSACNRLSNDWIAARVSWNTQLSIKCIVEHTVIHRR